MSCNGDFKIMIHIISYLINIDEFNLCLIKNINLAIVFPNFINFYYLLLLNNNHIIC